MMDTHSEVTYFLGANAPGGFHSIFDHMLPLAEARAIYILKGGPGCGKSTLMGRVEAEALARGLETEAILCSGDPDSLDAIVLPDLHIAVLDGTPPHVMEAKCPGAIEHYVNLEDCYDASALYPIRAAIQDCKRAYQKHYAHAYRCLEACAALREEDRTLVLTQELAARLRKRAEGLLARTLPVKKDALPGKSRPRFLSTPTHRGMEFLYETALVQCPKIYNLQDSSGLAHEMLTVLLTGALERGYGCVPCPDPMAPDRLAHLLVPEAGVAFLSSAEPLPRKPHRRLRLDAMADPELLHRNSTRLKFSRRVSEALFEEAAAALAAAKAGHDDLEALYHPHVDFARVEAYGQRVCREIFSLLP